MFFASRNNFTMKIQELIKINFYVRFVKYVCLRLCWYFTE